MGKSSSSSSLFGTMAKIIFVIVALMAVGIKVVMSNANLLHVVDKFLDSFVDMKAHMAKNFFLQGNYFPVSEEHINQAMGVVEGELPPDLNGLFVRSGPNEIPSQISKRYHLFDGHGMLHNVRIQNGKATYTNKFVKTPRYQYEKDLGESYFLRIGELQGWLGLLKAIVFMPTLGKAAGLDELHQGTANTASIMFRNKFYCLHEGSLPFEINLNDDGSFQEVGYDTMHNATLDYPFSAHGKKDPMTGNLVFHGYSADPSHISRDGTQKVGEISAETGKFLTYGSPNPTSKVVTFAHDFAFTKNWMLVIETSVQFAAEKIVEGGVFSWNDKAPMRIGLVPRPKEQVPTTMNHKDVLWFESEKPLSITHLLTSWEEEDGTVVLWAPTTESMDWNAHDTEAFNSTELYFMMEFRMNPSTGSMTTTVIDDKNNMEFALVRDDCYGQFCRFGYAALIRGVGLHGIVKYDMQEKKAVAVIHFSDEEEGGESVVIPKPGKTESHEVYLATFVHNAKENRSYFVLYDGEEIVADAKPVVRLAVPSRVPFGFHGRWVSEADLRAHISAHQSTESVAS